MDEQELSGANRDFTHLSRPMEKEFIKKYLPKIPRCIETYHLTLTTLVLSLLSIAVGYFSRMFTPLLVLNSLIIVIQYIADVFDGAVGRYRRTGLVRWGFYMDHLLDFVFACSMVTSYALAFHMSTLAFSLMIIVLSVFYLNEFLTSLITAKSLNTSGYFGIGVTEIRFFIIAANFIFIFLPLTIQQNLFVIITVVSIISAFHLVYKKQKGFWILDMQEKAKNKRNNQFKTISTK